MAHDLSLARSYAFDLARTLMVPVTLFLSDGAFGVLPTDELDGAPVQVIHEFDPHDIGAAR